MIYDWCFFAWDSELIYSVISLILGNDYSVYLFSACMSACQWVLDLFIGK